MQATEPPRPALEAPARLVLVAPDFIADCRIGPGAKLLILAVRSLADVDGGCSPSDAEIADRMGLPDPTSRATRRAVQKIILAVEGSGHLRRVVGPNGKRTGFDLATVDRAPVPHDATPETHHPATVGDVAPPGAHLTNEGDEIQPAPELRRLDRAELGTYAQLAAEARLSRRTEDRYRVSRYLIRRMYPDLEDPPLTVVAVSDTLGTAWRHGSARLKGREVRAAVALRAAGITLDRVPGFAQR